MGGRSPAGSNRPSESEFRELVRRVLDGQPGAWSRFVEDFSGTVHAFALHLARRDHGLDRQEVAQHVYAVVFERLARNDFQLLRNFRGEARFETYLFQIVRNEIAKYRRDTGRDRRLLVASDDPESSAAMNRSAPEPGAPRFVDEIALDERRVTDLLERALSRLEPQQRSLLRLRFAEGVSLRGLASLFGWKDTNAAAYEICRALRKLDLLGRHREAFRWGEAEERILRRHIRQWLGATSPGDAETGDSR